MAQGVYMSSHRKRWKAFLICLFFGIFGGHYYYVGRWGKGLVYTFTVGFFIIGWLRDLVRIARGRFYDDHGMPLID